MIKISAGLENSFGEHNVILETNGNTHELKIESKSEGFGSKTNGGELLFLALATCFCNDIYREANKRQIKVTKVEVNVSGEFGAEGEPAKYIEYGAKVSAEADENEIIELIKHTDKVAEIQNTLRPGIPVILKKIDALSA